MSKRPLALVLISALLTFFLTLFVVEFISAQGEPPVINFQK